MAALVLLVLFLALLPIYLLLTRSSSRRGRLPPGSMGLPVVGHSLQLLRAMRRNTADDWVRQRIQNYGPVSKLSLFGTPTVFLTGTAANKFIFQSDALALKQPQSIPRILGKKNILELMGDDHKRVRGALLQFLRPEMLKRVISKIDEDVRHHITLNWTGRQTVTVLPLMRRLTFDIISSVIFGLERGEVREELVVIFRSLINGIWAVPINLPFTRFNKSLRASRRARTLLDGIMKEKRIALEQGRSSPHGDLISSLLSLRDEDGGCALTDEEIIDNTLTIMVGGYDTSSILITFMIRQLANDPITYAKIVEEQEEISNNKAPGEALTWDDINKMKYTWRVAMETLRTVPPVFGMFRKVLKDVEFDGYLIPKGWQVFWATSVTHMDDHLFEDPTRFDPARFEKQTSIPPYAFVPFGGGARICPGNELARMDTLVAMHYLVMHFKWRLLSKEDGFVRDPMPTPTKGLPIQLEPKGDLKMS